LSRRCFPSRSAGWISSGRPERLDVEGVAAKRMADLYTPETVWLKVKNRVYTQTEGRWELFHGPLV
jgi:hypothetical protein